MTGTVVGYKWDASGNLIGKANPNPLLNTRMYQVQFSDGTVQDYAANHIAEAIYAAVDDEGNRFVLLEEILDCRYANDALHPDKAWIESSNGNCRRVKTTKGCELCVRWKDGSTSWETLANLKNSDPIEVCIRSKFITGSSLCLVGPEVFGHCPSNCECCQGQIQEMQSKVWNYNPKVCSRSPENRQGYRNHVLGRRYRKGNEK